MKQFPHGITELVFLFNIYVSEIPTDEWESRFILLIWISLLLMNPFDLSSIDVSKSEKSIGKRMLEAGQSALFEAGKARDGAAVFLSRLLTRYLIE